VQQFTTLQGQFYQRVRRIFFLVFRCFRSVLLQVCALAKNAAASVKLAAQTAMAAEAYCNANPSQCYGY